MYSRQLNAVEIWQFLDNKYEIVVYHFHYQMGLKNHISKLNKSHPICEYFCFYNSCSFHNILLFLYI
ncbi:hypothetical protein GA345_14600 [Escherichia coli]|nr:hypothetical protein [Escherichia coli]